MTDTRVWQQPFKICLWQSCQVPIHQRSRCQKDQSKKNLFAHRRKTLECLDHPEQDNETYRFRSNRKKCGGRRWSPLINVRNPELEWRSGYLETKPDQDEECAEK